MEGAVCYEVGVYDAVEAFKCDEEGMLVAKAWVGWVTDWTDGREGRVED